MMLLDISKLQEYGNWIGRNPIDILKAVRNAGGWKRVFPENREGFPLWASRVRNYFNIRPSQLTQLGTKERGRAKSRNSLTPASLFDQGIVFGTFSLSGDVYEDEIRRPWFEMSTVATVYHFPGKVNWLKKLNYLDHRQKNTPVFKLISPDGTGGSLELCIHNFQHWGAKRRSEIGSVGEKINLFGIVVINEQYQGSYNYSDNGIDGNDAHEYRDVQPHKKGNGFYLPVGRDITKRRFPELDSKQRAIADSNNYY